MTTESRRIISRADSSLAVEVPHSDGDGGGGGGVQETLIYTKSGSGRKIPGTNFVFCADAAIAVAAFLQGGDVAADYADSVPFVPQFDVQAGGVVGTSKPLVVFIKTDHSIDGIPTSMRYHSGRSGVFTCRKERAVFYKDNPDITWVESRADVHRILKSEDKYLQVARLLLRTSVVKKWIDALKTGLQKILRLVFVVLV